MNVDFITPVFIVGILSAMIRLATPILLTALGEVFTERAGILNLGLEGIMLMGALSGFLGAFLTNSLWFGLLISMLVGILFALLMGFMSVTAKVNQVVAGIGITILGGGLSTLLFRLSFGLRSVPPQITTFKNIPIPLLSQIPGLGEIVFNHNILVYLSLLLVPVTSLVLYHTRLGLAIRSVGENPDAADSRGINVDRTRYIALMIGGALAGFGRRLPGDWQPGTLLDQHDSRARLYRYRRGGLFSLGPVPLAVGRAAVRLCKCPAANAANPAGSDPAPKSC
jgi:general nucleoside transport system permease protein